MLQYDKQKPKFMQDDHQPNIIIYNTEDGK